MILKHMIQFFIVKIFTATMSSPITYEDYQTMLTNSYANSKQNVPQIQNNFYPTTAEYNRQEDETNKAMQLPYRSEDTTSPDNYLQNAQSQQNYIAQLYTQTQQQIYKDQISDYGRNTYANQHRLEYSPSQVQTYSEIFYPNYQNNMRAHRISNDETQRIKQIRNYINALELKDPNNNAYKNTINKINNSFVDYQPENYQTTQIAQQNYDSAHNFYMPNAPEESQFRPILTDIPYQNTMEEKQEPSIHLSELQGPEERESEAYRQRKQHILQNIATQQLYTEALENSTSHPKRKQTNDLKVNPGNLLNASTQQLYTEAKSLDLGSETSIAYPTETQTNDQKATSTNLQQTQAEETSSLIISPEESVLHDEPTHHNHHFSHTVNSNNGAPSSPTYLGQVLRYIYPSKLVHTNKPFPISKHVQITRTLPVPIVKQIHVPYKKPVKIEIPHPILVPIPKAIPIQIPITRPYAVPLVKEISIPIEKVVPFPVEKRVPYTVEKHVPYTVEKQVTVQVPQPYPVRVPVIKTIVHKSRTYLPFFGTRYI